MMSGLEACTDNDNHDKTTRLHRVV